MAQQPAGRRRLGELLVAAGVLTEDQVRSALMRQDELRPGASRARLGQVVVDAGYCTDLDVAAALAQSLGLPLADLTGAVDPEAVRLLPRQVAERVGVLVLARDGETVTVAATDPTNVVGLDDVKVWTGASRLVVQVAPEARLRDQLHRSWSLAEAPGGVEEILDRLDVPDNAEPRETFDAAGVDDAPVVRLVEAILGDAVRAHASDVHVEPQRGELRIRYRVDGLLRDVMTVPAAASAAVVSRIKIVSGLDIAERRRPQDGRARIAVDGQPVEARISTLPSLHGEKVVVRLLPRAEAVPLLHRTGLTEDQVELVASALVSPRGLVLLTGPTGSGKTNTLYAALQQVSTPDRNIVTLEDPVEVQVPGITQVQVSEKSGLTFARGLRSVLRQDPDIILVGETRDLETAELALQASLTGHLVLTTLHTNDAVGAVSRLVDMGVDPFLVASSLTLVVAQRLVRRPCPDCAAPYSPPARTLELLGIRSTELEGATPRRGRGCEQCAGSGYSGRTGVFEVLPVTAELRRVLLSNPTEAAIAAAARAHGMVTLRAAALRAAARGDTTYEEALRVTHVDAVGGPRCSSCARALADDMVVCPWDGTPIVTGRCAECARQLDPAWSVCPWCRTATGAQASAPHEVEQLPSVLVVDDDASVAAFVKVALMDVAEVTIAPDATTALELVGAGSFHAVVVDQGLPDLTGVEFIRLLRADPRTLTLPVALFTGGLTAEVERTARLAGAEDILVKPLDPDVLEARVAALLDRETRLLPTAAASE